MPAASLSASPLDQRVEFLSSKWLELAQAELGRLTSEFSGEIKGIEYSLCEVFDHAPPHLGFDNNQAVWHVRFKGGEATVGYGRIDNPDFTVTSEYQMMLPIAQAVGPRSIERMHRQIEHLFGQGVVQLSGARPEGRIADILGELHDYLARRTVENPNLQHRLERQGLLRHAQEVEELGYTVIRNAISDDFADELRERCVEEMLMHKRPINRSGRLDSMGLITRGRIFEEIAQHPTLRSVMETALGPCMIIQSISCAMKGPGPGAIPIHADYPGVPNPYPHFALVGVAVWAFEDWTVESGPTWIIPGSHRNYRAPTPSDPVEGAVPILLNKGDVTFFTHGVWHWQGERSEPGYRVSMHNAYQRMFMRPVDDLSNLDEVLHRNSPVMSMLTGQDDMFEKSNYNGHDMKRAAYTEAMANWRSRHKGTGSAAKFLEQNT